MRVRPHARWNQTRFHIPGVRSVGLRSVTHWLLIKRAVALFTSGGGFCFFLSSNLHMMRLISSVPSTETTPGQTLYYLLNAPSPLAPPPPCEVELRAVRATCHESHMHPNLRSVIKCRFPSGRVGRRSAIRLGAAALNRSDTSAPIRSSCLDNDGGAQQFCLETHFTCEHKHELILKGSADMLLFMAIDVIYSGSVLHYQRCYWWLFVLFMWMHWGATPNLTFSQYMYLYICGWR